MRDATKELSAAEIVILGAGPAALTLAQALQRLGLRPLVIGRPRLQPAVEGLSYRVAQGLHQLGCTTALALLDAPGQRLSSWAGTQVEMNGEFVVERQAFDAALAADARRSGIKLQLGVVHQVDRQAPGEWRIGWENEQGALQTTRARFVVESRGRAAPKWAPDCYAGAPALALTRALRSDQRGRGTTFTESFAEGWAWGALSAGGDVTVQLVFHPERLKAHEGDLDAAHAAGMFQLQAVRKLLGETRPTGKPVVRGIQTVWRGGCCLEDGLRVGDAAYTSDPLSGHGMFEALSGALAAAPVIRTLLERPAAAALARSYYESRIESVFTDRLRTAAEHYATETRWPASAFWCRMQALQHASLLASAPVLPEAGFVNQPVVENGFIVERRVVRTPKHPRGVRFVDGVDLPVLHDLVRRGALVTGVEQLSRQLGGRPEAVCHALHWLRSHRLIDTSFV